MPLSVLPFLTYGFFTTEGRLLRDRLITAISPPTLPLLSAEHQARVVESAPRYGGKVMALVYHGVGSTSDAEGGFVVSPGRFGEHLATLRAAGMQAVTASDVARAFAGGTPVPDNAVLITFDDGRSDALMFADPLLEQAGMKATMFLISSATDRPNLYYAGWGRIERAARTGRWDIQAHTHDSHREETAAGGTRLPVLTSLAPGESLEEYRARVRKDLDRNDAAIEDHVGRPPVAFAYPFGAYGADRTNDPRIREVLASEVSRRYLAAFHQDEQESVALLDPGHDRMGLRRLEVGDWSGVELLGRIADAAAGRPAADEASDEPLTELVAPAPVADGPARPTAMPTPDRPRSGRREARPQPGPAAAAIGRLTSLPEPSTTTTSAGPPSTTTTQTTAVEPTTTQTTAVEPTTTTTAAPTAPTTVTTQPSSTTTSTQPPTSTTTRPRDTTTTTEKPCKGRGKDGRACRS
jgi:peptidoglycan/xylan/chitin deacetylase (PgdA/CDA1 family)